MALLKKANRDNNNTLALPFAYHWLSPRIILRNSLCNYGAQRSNNVVSVHHLDLLRTRGSCLSIAVVAVAFWTEYCEVCDQLNAICFASPCSSHPWRLGSWGIIFFRRKEVTLERPCAGDWKEEWHTTCSWKLPGMMALLNTNIPLQICVVGRIFITIQCSIVQ